jgi:N-acetylneuraminic acid mutarotase
MHKPGNVAYHSSIIHKDNMYIFGGNNTRSQAQMEKGEACSDEYCDKMFYLNLKTMSWSLLRTRGDDVYLRDEHTAVYDEESAQMIVFGGFVQGTRVNLISIYNFTNNSWKNVEYHQHVNLPCARSGHSTVVHGGNMYVFGGKNDDC